MDPSRPDILILGAGILGSSAAWHLAKANAGSIAVLDLDLNGTFSSSELNAGGARATWWQAINCSLSASSIRFFETIAEEIQFSQKGYLFLYHQQAWQTALQKKQQYLDLGWPVDYLKPGELGDRLPEFRNLKGVAGATFSRRDGLLDPHLLKEYYRSRGRELGVSFLDRRYVTQVETAASRVTAVHARHYEAAPPLGEEALESILINHRISQSDAWREERYQPKILVNCTGAWLPVTSQYYGDALPVQPVRRQISLCSSHEEDFSARGMIVDASGLYFHPEGQSSGMLLAGYSNPDEPAGYSFRYDGEKYFDRKIWLRLYRRGGREHFAAVKHIRGWAGLYAVGPDRTGILGPVAGLENAFVLGAATGRGVMQSYALGLLLAEQIKDGRYSSADGNLLSSQRFTDGKFLPEDLDI